MNWKKVGRILAKPVTVPATLVKKGTDKAMAAMVLGLIRHALTTLGGGLVADGLLEDSDLQAVVGAIVTLVGIAWSVIEKRQAKKLTALQVEALRNGNGA